MGSRLAFESTSHAFNDDGTVSPGAKMYLYEVGSTTPYMTYSDPNYSFPQSAPIIADASGYFPQVYIKHDGIYKIIIRDAENDVLFESGSIQIGNIECFPQATVAGLLANTSLTYTVGTGTVVEAGDVINVLKEGYSYEVQPAAASDYHLTTAGGVKLKVVPIYGPGRPEYPVDALGVDTTGITSCDVEIGKLVYTAGAAGGGCLVFGGGLYKFDEVLTLQPYVSMRGAGGSNTTIVAGHTEINLVDLPSTEPGYGITIEDIGFEGSDFYELGKSMAIRVRAHDEVTIRRCRFVKFQVAAVQSGLTALSGSAIYKNFRFYDNFIDGGGTAVPFSGIHVYNGDGVWVERNTFTRVARPIDFEQNNDSFVQNVWVLDNLWYNCSQSTHSSSNTYQGIHFATDGNEPSTGFDSILIDGNVSINNTHSAIGGGKSDTGGYEINIALFSRSGGTSVEIRSHTSIGFSANGELPNRACNFQLVPGLKVGTLTFKDPQRASMVPARIRDCPGHVVDLIDAQDGASIAWADPIIVQKTENLCDATRAVYGRIRGNDIPTLLDAISEGNRTLSGTASDLLEGKSISAEAEIDFMSQTSAFHNGATLTGAISGATAKIRYIEDNGTTGRLGLSDLSGSFVDCETITDDANPQGSAKAAGASKSYFAIKKKRLLKGAMKANTRIKVTTYGQFQGTACTKSIGLRWNDLDIVDFTHLTTANEDDFEFRAILIISDSGAELSYVGRLIPINGASFAEQYEAGRLTSLDFDTTAYTISAMTYVTDSADTIEIRTHEWELIEK